MSSRYRIVLAVAMVLWAAGPSRADLTLTQAAIDANFRLSTFALGFPVDPNEGNGPAGPLGIAFPSGPGGGVLVTDAPGNVRIFSTDTDGQNAGAVTPAENAGRNNALGLAQIGSNIYMTENAAGLVVQLNPDGTFNQALVNITTPTGIVVDPRDNHLLVASQLTNTILDVNPLTKTAAVFLSNVPAPDGMTFSSDGSTL